MTVTFMVDEPDPDTEVVLDIDFLLHPAWPDIDHLVLHPTEVESSRRTITVELPSDLEISYRYLRRPRSGSPVRPRASAPGSLDDLRALCASGRPGPDVPERIDNPFGSRVTTSVLIGPNAPPRHKVWRDEGSQASVTVSRFETPAHRTVTIIRAAAHPIAHLVVILDGDVWVDSLELSAAVAQWNEPDTAFVLVSTPDRENLAERTFMSMIIAEEVLPLVTRHLSVRPGPSATIVGHSYGGLAAAGLACDRPDLFSSAIIGSGSFWYRKSHDARDEAGPGDLTMTLQQASVRPLSGSRLLLHVGREEGGMIDQSRMFVEAAESVGAEVDLSIYPGGHDYAWYRHALFDTLDALRASRTRSVDTVSVGHLEI